METAGKFERIRALAGGADAAIFGAGASGRAAAELLKKAGTGFSVYALDAGAPDFAAKPFSSEAAKSHRLVVYSPAFRPDHEWIRLAEENGACAICEPDLLSLIHISEPTRP